MASSISEDRRGLYESAISFLNDQSVSDAPLTKKIEFLQSKGLTREEIDQAIKEAKSGSSPTKSGLAEAATDRSRQTDYVYEAIPPPLPRRDWKDYFVMATASAGLCYGVYQLAKRYVIPNILPDSKSKLEQDKEQIMQQFDKMEQLLSTVEQDHSSQMEKEEQKFKELDEVVVDLQTALEGNVRTREKLEDDVRILRLEIEGLQKNLNSFILENTDSPAIRKLNDEILSLKNLMKNSAFLKSDTPSEADKSPVPGAEAIPSASEILAKMNIPKKNDGEVPAWKKGRDASTTHKDTALPEWQKTAAEKAHTPIPEWQKAMFNAESPSPEESAS
ncbi:LAQU0S13e02300g1_1 [Lachancea quebecensis]|uniref:Peroxisomal membrane protein PEX14 n=1 Tax=Lachancea quebecensis TaxID=1654605 RepID=A0A0P1KXH8_9SACH|nr:LAQU0S13e02300g1_1 [Lachancea quebecensis]